ncbi:baseplate assembly protein [Mixta calida]|uniref:baseplate assembly protein n=1 Tax=Mixta calida TaxID=665913 RepID=UPI0034D78576
MAYNLINLSELPVPDALVMPSAETIFSSWLTRLRDLDPEFSALVESDPAFKQGEASAYQLSLAFQRINDAVRAVLLASAGGADLDQVGAAFNVARMEIKPADPDAVPPVPAEMESDTDFRERIQISWAQLNTAGARNAYHYHARSAHADVLDVDAYGPETHGRPGEVEVWVLSRTGKGEAPADVIEAVRDRVNGDEVRPLTDYVTVRSAKIQAFQITADLEIADGPDASPVLSRAIETVTNYAELMHRIYTVVPVSGIYAALQQPGVSRVKLHSPTADIEAQPGMAPWCETITVKRTGETHGE